MISESRAAGKSNAATRAGTMTVSCYSVRLCTPFWFPVRPFSFLQPAGRTVSRRRRRRRLDERLCEEGRAEGSREEIHPHSSTLECLTEAPVPGTGDARYRLQPLGGRIRGGSPVWMSHQTSEPASCVSAAARSSTDGQMKSRPKPASSSSALGCNATGWRQLRSKSSCTRARALCLTVRLLFPPEPPSTSAELKWASQSEANGANDEWSGFSECPHNRFRKRIVLHPVYPPVAVCLP